MNLDPGLRLLWFPHILRFVLFLFVLCWPLPIICKVCKAFCLGQSRCSFQCTFLQRKNFVSNFNPLQVVFYPLRIIKIAKYCKANAITYLNIWLKMNGMTLTDKLSRSAYLFHVAIYRICKHNRNLYKTFETYYWEAKKRPWGSISTFCQSQKL